MLTSLLSLALVNWVALMSPGPDFFFVSQTAISQSRGHAFAAVAGISLGILIWAFLSLVGLQILFTQWPWIQRVFFVIAGAYMLWLAWQLAKSAVARQAAPVARTHAATPQGVGHAFLFGLLTNLANPKAVIYFGSIFSMFVHPGQPLWQQLAALSIVALQSPLWFGIVALLFGLPAMQKTYALQAHRVDALAALIFTGFGLALFWEAIESLATI